MTRSMRDDGFRKVLAGVTTLDDVDGDYGGRVRFYLCFWITTHHS